MGSRFSPASFLPCARLWCTVLLVAVLVCLGGVSGCRGGTASRIRLPDGDHLLVYADMPHTQPPPGRARDAQHRTPFLPGRFHPSVRYLVREPDGRTSHFFLDAGVDSMEFQHNRRIDLASLRSKDADLKPDFLIISHYHTIFLPSALKKFFEENNRLFHSTPFHPHDGGGIAVLLQENPDLDIYVPELKNFTYDMLPPVWRENRLLERVIQLKDGYVQITPRVGLLTQRFLVGEEPWLGYNRIPENLLVVKTPSGYLVHAVCAHRPARTLDGRTPHPAEFLALYMPHPLEALPVHTLLTGGCDFQAIATLNGSYGAEGAGFVYRMIRERFPSLETVVPIHCGLLNVPACRDTFGDRCTPGLPGTAVTIR
ncbi:MAG: hypothetical protein JXB39_13635 [Deltaproteobacteria bacterium]|nr:hypothetical protein [Deltaproteobacteria bacterium]